MRVNSSRLAVLLLAPALVVLTPALAMADDGPGNDSGSSYTDNRSQSGRDGASSDRIRSCVDEDGNVSYQRTRSTADENGTSTRHTSSGDNSVDCNIDGDGASDADSSSGGNDNNRSGSRGSDGDRGSRGSTVGFGGGDALLSVSLGNISLFNTDFGDEDLTGFGDDFRDR